MVSQMLTALQAWLRKRIADSVRSAILSGTADGINAAADSLGMTAPASDVEPPPPLKILYVEPEPAPPARTASRPVKGPAKRIR